MINKMLEFFTYENGIEYKMFGFTYFIVWIIVILSIFLIYKYREKLRKYNNSRLKKIFSLILFLNMVVYYINLIMLGRYDLNVHLPLYFCFVTGFSYAYMLYKDDERLYKTLYFFAFMGPIPAMILTDLDQSFNRYIFWQFHISHHLLVIINFYALFVFKYKVDKKDSIIAFRNAIFVLIFIYIFNYIFKTNYMTLNYFPENVVNNAPFLKNYLNPIIWQIIAGLIVILFGRSFLLLNKKEPKDT